MGTKQDREDAALDALIVWAFRGHDEDDIDIDLDSLPELTPEEMAALAAIDIEEIIRKAKA